MNCWGRPSRRSSWRGIEPKITPESVQKHCRKRLPAFKIPESVVFLKQMPHNSSGKILKAKLKEMNGAVVR